MRSVCMVVLAVVLASVVPAFISATAAQIVAEPAPVVPLEILEPEPAPIPPVAPDFDFEGGVPANWQVTVGEATMQIAQLPQNVAGGAGALECLYTPFCIISAGNLVPQPAARSIRLSLKTAEPTNLVYGVREADGSTYQSFCCVPGGAWQQIALDLGELVLAQDSDDENGQLDVDQINEVQVGDLANLQGEVGEALGQKMGQQTLWLDERAPQATSMVVVLEERDLTKYETRLELAGGEQWEELVFPIQNFILDDDSQDENGALDLPQLRVMILLCDMLTSGVDMLGKGSLAIDEIAFQAQ